MKIRILSLIVILLLLSSCDEDSGTTSGTNGFDRQPYLESYSQNVIIPRYQEYLSSLESLKYLSENYVIGNDKSEIQNQLLESWKLWQYVAFYDFGPALDNNLLAQTNTYPTDTFKISQNVNNTQYKLSSVANFDAKGFPALDYILFSGIEINNSSWDYFIDIVNDMYSNTNSVLNGWSTYKSDFDTRDGNDVGSSLGLMINSFNLYLERNFRNGKIAIPLGWKTGGHPLPDHVEGYYSGYSKELLSSGAKAIREFYLGGDNVSSERGLYGMLESVGNRYQSGELPEDILSDIENLINLSSGLNNSIDILATNNDSNLNDTYTAAKKLVVQFKSNLPSALGVLITYQDNDGD